MAEVPSLARPLIGVRSAKCAKLYGTENGQQAEQQGSRNCICETVHNCLRKKA